MASPEPTPRPPGFPADGYPVPPVICQRGHPLIWLLGTDDALADGEGLAACDCTLRHLGGRQFASPQPMLWRWVPARPNRLHPVFPSQSRLAFALAIRLRGLIVGHEPLNQELRDTIHQAKHVLALASQTQETITRMEQHLDQATPYRRRRAKAPASPQNDARAAG